MENTYEFTNENLYFLFKKKKIQQDELAIYLGITPSTLCLKMQGKTDFKANEIVKIAKYCSCTFTIGG